MFFLSHIYNVYGCCFTAPSDRDLLGSMMSRLAQVEQQLKGAQTQLLEKVRKVIRKGKVLGNVRCMWFHFVFGLKFYSKTSLIFIFLIHIINNILL